MDSIETLASAVTPWQALCLRRLQRALELTPAAAPAGLSPLEAFALLEWTRMAVYGDCHAAGAGQAARELLRALRRSPAR